MNREEFFRRLEYLLQSIPESERMDALAYYNDYFDDAGIENEQRVIQELGSPEDVAQMILEDYYKSKESAYENYGTSDTGWNETNKKERYTYSETTYRQTENGRNEKKKRSKTEWILWIVLLILTFPIWIGILAAMFGIALGLLGSLFGVTIGVGGAGIGMLFGGFFCLFVGLLRLFVSPIEGIVTIGVGAILSAISILLILFIVLLVCKWIPIFIRFFVKCMRRLFVHQRGGDEI